MTQEYGKHLLWGGIFWFFAYDFGWFLQEYFFGPINWEQRLAGISGSIAGIIILLLWLYPSFWMIKKSFELQDKSQKDGDGSGE